MAVLNLTQMALRETLGQVIKEHPNKAFVCDGVSVGIPKRNCYLERPYEEPYNLPAPGSTVQLSDLQQGCEVKDIVMIPPVKFRKALATLVGGKTISQTEWDTFRKWMSQSGVERSFLKHYILTEVISLPWPLNLNL